MEVFGSKFFSVEWILGSAWFYFLRTEDERWRCLGIYFCGK